MTDALSSPLPPSAGALYALGQSGFLIRSSRLTVVIDPYLSDSVGAVSPDFSRAVPAPIAPEDLKADVFIVTHDHLDHLDPDTVRAYRHVDSTTFVAPRLAARKLASLGIPDSRITRVDSGESADVRGLTVTGVYAVPTSRDVLDSAGYLLAFPSGRTVYHTGDTAFSQLLLDAAPKAEVLLVCINGKWGNLNVSEAVRLASAISPRIAVPMHYDVMLLNSENPRTFEYFLRTSSPSIEVRLPKLLEPVIWQ
jgi:L-ascorbate 6-phosphate lactonase